MKDPCGNSEFMFRHDSNISSAFRLKRQRLDESQQKKSNHGAVWHPIVHCLARVAYAVALTVLVHAELVFLPRDLRLEGSSVSNPMSHSNTTAFKRLANTRSGCWCRRKPRQAHQSSQRKRTVGTYPCFVLHMPLLPVLHVKRNSVLGRTRFVSA